MAIARDSTIKARTFKQGPRYNYYSKKSNYNDTPILEYVLFILGIILSLGVLGGLGYGIYRLVKYSISKDDDIKKVGAVAVAGAQTLT
jgi:hypothetical protein